MSSIYLRDGIWQYQCQRPGKKPLRRSLATRSKVEARQKQHAIDGALLRGEQPIVEARGTACLLSWTSTYRAWAVKHINARTVVEKMRYLDEWIAITGKDDITNVTPADIERYKDKLLESNMNVTINTKLIHVSSYVERCRRLGLHDEKNPFNLKMREKLPVAKRHKAWLSNPDDIKSLLTVANTYDRDLYLFIMLGLFAGLRRGEIDAARWEWLDWDRTPPLLHILNCAEGEDGFSLKDKTDRTVPICEDLRVVLEPLRQESGYIVAPDYTMPNDEGIRRCFAYRLKTVAKHAGIKIHLTPHILRHTFASRLASAGVSLLEIAKYLGHEDPKLTYSVYAHLNPSSESINKLNLGA